MEKCVCTFLTIAKSSSIFPWRKHTHTHKKETEVEKVKQGLTAVGLISLISSKLGQSFLDGYQLQFTWATCLLHHTVSPCLSPWLVTAAGRSSGHTPLTGCQWERTCSNRGSNLKSHCWKPEDDYFISLLLFWWMAKKNILRDVALKTLKTTKQKT